MPTSTKQHNYEYSNTIEKEMIAGLMKTPSRLQSYPFSEQDFEPHLSRFFYKAIVAIDKTGLKTIDVVVIEEYLNNHFPSASIYYQKHDGRSWLNFALQLYNPENFDANYQELKKRALLRSLRDKGYNIEYYDSDSIDPKEADAATRRFLNATPDEIISHFQDELDELKYSSPCIIPLAVPFDKWTEEDKKEPPYIIEDWMCYGSFNSFVAASKMGKTQLAMQTAWSIQNGFPFMDRQVNPCDVLYMDFELPKYASAKRVKYLLNFFKNGKPFLIDNLDGEAVRHLKVKGLVDRIDQYRKINPNIKCVFLDCFYRFFHEGDPNSSTDVEKALEPFHTYCRENGVSINTITHTTKQGISEISNLIYAAGGSGVWGQIVDETYGLIERNKGKGLYRVVSTGRNFGDQEILCQKNKDTFFFFKPVDEAENTPSISPEELKSLYPELCDFIGEGKNKKTILSHFPDETLSSLTAKGFIRNRQTDKITLPPTL